MFKIVCAWCHQTIKEDIEGAPVSHLICPPCYEKQIQLLQEKPAEATENENPRAESEKPSD